MKYYIKSVIDYIDGQLKAVPGSGNRFQMMIPSLPAKVTLELANRLEKYCSGNNIRSRQRSKPTITGCPEV